MMEGEMSEGLNGWIVRPLFVWTSDENESLDDG